MVGKAHQEAEAAIQRSLQEELEKKEREIKDQKARHQRGAQALNKEKALLQEKRAILERIDEINRKKSVQLSESHLAH